jgi:hypothetical protein
MKLFIRSLSWLVLVALFAVGSLSHGSDKTATGSPPPLFGPHDGAVTKTKRHSFEVVFAAGGLSVYMFDAEMAPMMMQRVKATAAVTITGSPAREVTLKLDSPKEGEKTLYFCPMHPSVAQLKPGTCEACGGMELIPQDCIRGAIDFSKAAPGAVSAVISIKGMKGDESGATFTAVWTQPPKK